MSDHDGLIARLARLAGIAENFSDAFGRNVSVSDDTRRAILTGLGLAVETEAEVRESLDQIERLRNGLVPAVIPIEAGRPARIRLRNDAANQTASFGLRLENGATEEGRALIDGAGYLSLPALRTGYHRLRLQVGGHEAHATVIAAPARCYEPQGLREGSSLWGITAQLYGLRSRDDFGIGDYGLAGEAAAGAGALGASFLGLSPVHALFSSDRAKFSPYSPSSRLFLETQYIDPRIIEGFESSEAARLYAEPEFQNRMQALREGPLVDYAGVWDLKRPLLESLWRDFSGRSHAQEAFREFRRKGSHALAAHAAFEALSEHFRREERWWPGDWPQEYRRRDSDAVHRFERDNPERVGFHAWLQWVADVQLGEAAEHARDSGMGIGLYRDLAVGADAGGSEIWAHPERFAPGLSIGAPPDLLGPQGQNWGLPPFNPLTLEEQGLAAFRALVRSNMRHAGAIRIDHAFQLARLYLIPQSAQAAAGAYVTYPFEAMLAVLRLESHRARCLVIAEDLGTAPEGFSDAIMAAGVFSYRVLFFEREEGGAFKTPEAYPERALAAITTHDLPTFTGWWRGLDIELRQTLGLFDHETAVRERHNRSEERGQLTRSLVGEGLLSDQTPPEEPPLTVVTRYLARSASSLVAVQLEDVAGEPNQPNLPGPDVGYPNWRRRLGTVVESLVAPGGDLAKLAAALSAEERGPRSHAGALASPPPRATYRLQFHEGFTLDDAARIVPYLARLGISHVYASPIHRARPGSTHGYDIVNHAEINPELGGEEGFRRLSDALKAHGLGLILDIVPNHMGVGGADNGWWLSVLEWGELSPNAHAFDVDWERLGAQNKLVVPFLGDRYGLALEKGDLKLAFDPTEGSFSVWHYEHRFPISPLSYPIVLDRALAALGDLEGSSDMLAVSERLRAMNDETGRDRRALFPGEAEELKARLARTAEDPEILAAIERAVALVNGAPGIPESFGTLHRILEMQSYRLAHWRVAASDINYRRFFDINGLAGIRIENSGVFDQTHEMVFRLVREDRIDGLRIDHIDGLADPGGYAHALQESVGPGFYVAVEKILEPGEELRPWPIAGTTGYDVLNLIDGVFVDTRAADTMERLYREATGLEGGYETLLLQAKTEILEASFASELEVLVSDAKRIADADRRTRDYTVYAMRRALIEIIARFPVYRSYLGDAEPVPEDRRLIEETVEAAKAASAIPDRSVHDFLATAILGGIETEGPGRPDAEMVARFRRRFQQLTGPVMAKSLEDTLFYRYVRLASLNEVGGDPGHFGTRLEAFHHANIARQRDWPHAMIATATHDTKRGEDTRARLNTLSEMPEAWAEAWERWRDLAEPHLRRTGNAAMPDANDQYLLLQTIVGAWPFELMNGTADTGAFRERIEAYVTKALREAKRHTSWVHVNEPYEAAALDLIRALLGPDGTFIEAFRPLARRLAFHGMLKGLARTVIKCTLPGVPDIYQGTEFWDLSLVDPDNRRPVDYESLARALDDQRPTENLLGSWEDGRIKQRILNQLLRDRAEAPGLYANGDYRPLTADGAHGRHVLAYTRATTDERLIVAVPRLLAGMMTEDKIPVGPEFWGNTAVYVPAGRWRDLLTGAEIEIHDGGHGTGDLPLGELFAALPIAVLRTQP